MFVFDNSRHVAAYGGVRLSYVPSEIAQMGQAYPAAIQALQSRRDENEKQVLAAKGDFDVIHKLTSLNEYLNQPERNIALLDKALPQKSSWSAVPPMCGEALPRRRRD
ncbi:MAG TPA: hypothetical protein VFS77_13645 [Pyrinomonadaceae bacterium]|nr:hypothetical protein [Pyrinomonadaceae bacterium]